MSELVIACVGKPSAGKSSFLNAVTDAAAKIGNYPFTTIEPNYGVAYYPTPCPCTLTGKEYTCVPRYGKCVDGKRYVPIKVLDVAGLVPDAHLGKGLGNQFLDDLRHARVLIHIVDASGTTNEKGETTSGYDPINDIKWLRHEIHQWIYNNLLKRWDSIKRRHVATKQSIAETMQLQLSGYGSTISLVNRFLSQLALKEPLEEWETDTTLHAVVDAFLNERFPTIIALNKIDMNESTRNVERICMSYPNESIVFISAASEIFLRRLDQQKYLIYHQGTDLIETLEDIESGEPREKELDGRDGEIDERGREEELGQTESALEEPKSEELKKNLRQMDEKNKMRVDKIKDLVLYRYGSTGVEEAIKAAVEKAQLIPAYPIKHLSAINGKNPFIECLLIPKGTTVRQFAKFVSPDLDKNYASAETIGHRQLAEDDVITPQNNIISFRTTILTDAD